jgi:cyclopropane fatty-acyl-phospholipid synthase-like methyltransferase
MTPEQTRTEVEFLERVLRIAPGAQLLDVPCGNGRHAIEVAKRGYRLTGVDQSEEFIAEVRSADSVTARRVLGDMCDLPWPSEFDGAYCFGNSFGYVADGIRDHVRAAGTVSVHLREIVGFPVRKPI